MTTKQALRCLSRGMTVIVTDHQARETNGELMSGLEWGCVAGSPPSKHQVTGTAVYDWGYRVRSPILNADGSFYRVRGQIAFGIGFVSEKKVRAL